MPISSADRLTCFRWWCRIRDKTAENSERTASATLFLSVKPSAAQDFRGVWDADG
jgi:hypothetical protein